MTERPKNEIRSILDRRDAPRVMASVKLADAIDKLLKEIANDQRFDKIPAEIIAAEIIIGTQGLLDRERMEIFLNELRNKNS